MKLLIKNYLKPNSTKVKRISFALKGFIGTIAISTYIQRHEEIAFWLLVMGAFIDFVIQLIDDEKE